MKGNRNNVIDFSLGWEKVSNPEAIRYYRQVQSTKTTRTPEELWYRKWIGSFTMMDTDKFTSALSGANVHTDHVIYDSSGYVVVPKSALQ